MDLKDCPNCGSLNLKRSLLEVTRDVAGFQFAAKVAGFACPHCGERFFDGQPLIRLDLTIALRLAEAGVLTPEALKFMRKATGLNGKEFAELLSVRPETVSRWESGKLPIDRATYAIVHQLVTDQLHQTSTTMDFLRSLAKPKHLPKKLRLGNIEAAKA